jgi:outer membrane receptor protein involved in Fe transport
MLARLPISLVAALALLAPAASAQSPYDVTVRERRPTTAASSMTVRARDIELRPITSPGEILRAVPGLVTAQHAGGGKADQILIRGFDADHGTDFASFFDGIPTNLRSHAHGQGYNDLHFVIPETIERVEVFKGPYFAEFGDFATAGAANLVPRERAAESLAKFEIGEFNTTRYLALASPRTGAFAPEGPGSALVAFEAHDTDGPFDSPQNMHRYLGYASLGWKLTDTQKLSGSLSFYDARWNASGQIPQRAIDMGLIDRFGSMDDSEGGDSGRWNFLLRHTWTPSPEERLQTTLWASRYDLDLYSDFTFYQRSYEGTGGPSQTDGIRQEDRRWLYGGEMVYRRAFEAGLPMALSAGVQTRTDDATVKLGNQNLRTPLDTTRESEILETSAAVFVQDEIFLAPWARAVLGLRGEWFWYEVDDRLGGDGQPDGQKSDGILLPKASLILSPFREDGLLPVAFGPLQQSELYFNYGVGYHSNDARDVLCNRDPNALDDSCAPRSSTLPKAAGYELGWRTSLLDRVDLAVSYWWLNLEQEIVFVGDEGTTEIRPRSRRQGVELETRVRLLDWLFYDLDVAYSGAEFVDNPHIAQAPRFTLTTGLTARHPWGIQADLRLRTLGRRYALDGPDDDEFPGIASNTKLHGYAVLDFALRYRWKRFEASLAVENITAEDWRSAEFYFPSQLADETAPVPDFHFTPGNSRNVRAGIAVYF